jgi:kynureninase
MHKSTDLSYAQQLDQQDQLAGFRDRFIIDDPDLIYLDGNSLGRLPAATPGHLDQVINKEWGNKLIGSWNEGWFEKPQALGERLAGLLGAQPDEVLVCDTTCINLFKLTAAALRARPDRTRIISDELNFPSDLYVFQGAADLLGTGHQLDLIPSKNSIEINDQAVEEAIDEHTALVALTHVAFKSAFMYDMARVTELAHQAGALMLWDLSHSIGAVPLDLNGCGVDLAVGCTYKYLNGGPGSPAFLYVRKELQNELIPPIWGWFGTRDPFAFNLDYETGAGASRFLVSTPHILSMAGIEPAVDILLEAGMENLRKKSIQQCDYLIYLFREWLQPLGYQLGSPVDAKKRGSHVSVRHPEAYRISRAMIDPDPQESNLRVIPDFRSPDNIRLGIAPLYTRFSDIHRALERMRVIVAEQSYQQYSKDLQGVT